MMTLNYLSFKKKDSEVQKRADKSKKSIIKEELKMMLREEGQILDLELETKKEQFKMTKKTQPKLFWDYDSIDFQLEAETTTW